MTGGTEDFIVKLGGLSYVGIFGISLIANILFIVPEEVVLIGLGYAARAGGADIFSVIAIVILGLLTSDAVLYTLSRGNSRIVITLYDRVFSKRIAFFSKKLSGNETWIEGHLDKVIFYSRFLMQLRFLGPFMAGKHKASVRTFLTYELAALVLYVPLLLWVGWYFRSRIERIIGSIDAAHTVILIMVIAIILLPFLQKLLSRAMNRPSRHESK